MEKSSRLCERLPPGSQSAAGDPAFEAASFSTFTAHALNSGVSVMKSYESLVRTFVMVSSGNAKLMNMVPRGDMSVTMAWTSTVPRRVDTRMIS